MNKSLIVSQFRSNHILFFFYIFLQHIAFHLQYLLPIVYYQNVQLRLAHRIHIVFQMPLWL